MVLLFLRDWRSVIVVVLNIPFALCGALVAMWLTGQTINLMTLGGLALAIGILVDESTVEVENIHHQMEGTSSVARAVRRGNQQTAIPRLLAMLCVLAVFIPSFFMQGAAQALFVPLSLAVGFAMVTSYLLSSTFVPVLSTWLLRHHHHLRAAGERRRRSLFERGRDAYGRAVGAVVRWRWVIVPAYLAGTLAVIVLVGRSLGLEIFPKVDAGRFQLRMRAPDGTRYEETERLAIAALESIGKEVGREKVAISIGYVGLIPSSYPINAIYQWTGGPEEAILRVAMKEGAKVDIERLKERLRRELSVQLPGVRLSFEPADIVSEVMSFGSPTPVDVAVTGPNLADDRAFAEKLRNELAQIPSLRDLHYGQSLDYPTISIDIDRERAGLSGVTAADIARSVVAATSSSRFMVPNYWPDPKTGIGYQVQVEIPYQIMDTLESIETVPIQTPGPGPADPSPRCGAGPPGYDAGRIRPLQHEAVGEPDRQHRRRGSGKGRQPRRAGDRTGGRAAQGGDRRRAGADPADGGDPPGPWHRPGDVNRRHLAAADGELPVGQARPDRRLDHAGGGRRRRAHAVAHGDNGQPPVVHGVNHGHRRGGRQRDSAGDVRRAAPPRGG